MKRTLTGCLVTLVAILAIGCGGGTRSTSTGVEWADYAPSLQSSIDRLATKADCEGLQAQFDAADANSAATMTRTGHNNAALMKYIDGRLAAAGCY